VLGLLIELKVVCDACGRPVPVNAFTERVTCGACHRAVAFDAEQWKDLLEEPLAELPELGDNEGRTRQSFGGATNELVYGRQNPRCRACKMAVDEAALELAERGWMMCGGCGVRMSIRRAPQPLAAFGAVAVIGEDPAQIAGTPEGVAASAPGGAKPVVLNCPSCRAPLSVDGSARLVKCTYCSTDVYLPDDLWQHLHPTATVARWYVWLRDVDVAAAKRATFRWYSLADVIGDGRGNLFAAGEDEKSDRFAVWCMGTDLAVRWVRDGLDYDDSDARIALDPRGRLLVWQKGKHSATVLSAADGSVIGKLGGKEHEGAKTHELDLDDGDWVEFDVDGTILALLEERLVRFSPDGEPRATWPPHGGLFGKKEEKLRPIYGPGHQTIDCDGAYVENVGSHPLTLDDYSHPCIGADGRFYVERSEWIACFDRTGHRVYRIKLPLDGQSGNRIAVDGAGRAYVLGHTSADPNVRKIVRVSADGNRVDVVATDRRAGGTLGGEEHLVVAPDGTLLLFEYGHRCRILDIAGNVVFQSDKSRESDKEEDEEAARRA
jgi:LSD1 subclass zinc finger protein